MSAESTPRAGWVDTDDLNDKRRGDEPVNDFHHTLAGFEMLAERFAVQAIALINGIRDPARDTRRKGD